MIAASDLVERIPATASTDDHTVAIDDLTSQRITTHHVPLIVERAGGKVVTCTVPVLQDALPSEAMASLWKTAKAHLTRTEKTGLAFHLLKKEVYRVPITSQGDGLLASNTRAVQEDDLMHAIVKHPQTLDDNPTAFFIKYHDIFAGNAAVRIRITVDKATLRRIGQGAILVGSTTLHICLGV